MATIRTIATAITTIEQAKDVIRQELKNCFSRLEEEWDEDKLETLLNRGLALISNFQHRLTAGYSYSYYQEIAAQAFFARSTNNSQILVWEGQSPGTRLVLVKPGTTIIDALDESKVLETQIRDDGRILLGLMEGDRFPFRYPVYHNGSDYQLVAYERRQKSVKAAVNIFDH